MTRVAMICGAILFAAFTGCAAPDAPQAGLEPLPTGDSSRTSLDRAGVNDPQIENRRWQLIELNGRPIAPPTGREGVYFELDATDMRVTGQASCNRFFGTYELQAGQRIQFGSEMRATLMACPELEQEREFFDTLRRVDNYSLGEGGLSLNRARMAPLARFREVPAESAAPSSGGH